MDDSKENGLEVEITKEIEQRFRNDCDHSIADDLRDYLLHYQLPRPAVRFVLKRRKQHTLGCEVAFHLSICELLKWPKWSQKSERALMEIAGETGDRFVLLPFVERYFHKVEDFYRWLRKRQKEVHGVELGEC